jgi:pyruvate dehydrogenase E2 component (dihydrolipoamide acetyltransferase)
MSVFTMPSLGADMEAGKLVEWLVGPGDKVARGDVVAVVETQKGAIEIEIFEAGEVAELLAEPGQTLPVGAPLARLRAPGADDENDPWPEPAEPARRPDPEHIQPAPVAEDEPPPAPRTASTPAPAPRPVSQPEAEPLASPAARALAREHGIDLADITGSGPGGALLLIDVENRLAAQPSPSPEPATELRPEVKPGLDMAEMRRAIAAAMARAKREIPHYYLSHEIDLQAAQDWLGARNAARTPEQRLLISALLIRATVRALSRVPELNGRYEGDPYAPSSAVHCGLAVAMRGGGLIAPAILDAQEKDPEAIMDAVRDLVARTRNGRLRMSEITKGTITVSSLGETGVDALFGVIYPPQVALVGFGAPRRKPSVQGDAVAPRVGVTASLAADHRLSDGRRGAVFLAEINRLLQEPESL